ncbi:hypothetical protein DFH28DRAFT_955287 [Melampsora americana]|nr:hypothetical protein DFH28DRAFT_955287 [Melampsora americana]
MTYLTLSTILFFTFRAWISPSKRIILACSDSFYQMVNSSSFPPAENTLTGHSRGWRGAIGLSGGGVPMLGLGLFHPFPCDY